MATQVPQTGGINDIANLFASLNPLFGQGQTHTVTSKSLDPNSSAQADSIIEKLFGDLTPDNLDALVGNILNRAKQTFAPGNILSNAAGFRGYSDTVATSLRNEATARATAEAMSARLDALNKAGATAGSIVGNKLNNSGTQDTNKNQDSSDLGNMLKYALPAAFLYDKFQKGSFNLNPFSTQDGDVDVNTTDIIPGSGDRIGGSAPVDTSPGAPDPSAPQDFGNASTLDVLPTQGFGDEPPVVDFGDGGDLSDAAPVADNVDNLDDIFGAGGSDNLDNVGGLDEFVDSFADGGMIGKTKVKPKIKAYADGGRIQPQNYTQQAILDAIAKKKVPTAALADSPTQPTQSTGTSGKRKGSQSDAAGSDDSNAAPDTGPDLQSGAFTGTPGVMGFALAGAHALIGDLPGAVMALAKSAAVNQALGNSLSGNTTAQSGDDLLADANSEGADDDLGMDMSADFAFGAPDMGSPGTDFGDSGASDGGAPGGGSAGASGSDGGGDGYEKGGPIKAKNKQEATGIDHVLIHATPGEYVLPTDTTDLLGEEFLDQIVAATHSPIRKAA